MVLMSECVVGRGEGGGHRSFFRVCIVVRVCQVGVTCLNALIIPVS